MVYLASLPPSILRCPRGFYKSFPLYELHDDGDAELAYLPAELAEMVIVVEPAPAHPFFAG